MNVSPDAIDTWQRALHKARLRSPASFDQWFSSVQFDGLRDGVLGLTARDEFVRDWVKTHFLPAMLCDLERCDLERCDLERCDLERSDLERSDRPQGDPPRGEPEGELARELSAHAASHRSASMGYPPAAGIRVDWRISSQLSTPIGTLPAAPAPPSVRLVPRESGARASFSESPESLPVRSIFPAAVPAPRAAAAESGSGRDAEAPRSTRRPPAGDGSGSARPPARPTPSLKGGDPINPKHTFPNFVVGPSNELAYAAAVASAGVGGPRYNPLFICGGTGLGKTHLMHSIAHRLIEERSEARVLYISAERFTNEFIEALQHHRMEEFRTRYRRNCDALLVDDIQFLAGREQTQEEFFHTFNALRDADKPIVVTSDKYPQELQRMPERLISRFTSGLVADIQTPAFLRRMATRVSSAGVCTSATSPEVKREISRSGMRCSS